MTTEELIPIKDFCFYHHVEISFINTLQDSGLIHTRSVEQEPYIDADDLRKLEKYIRLHYDLDINIEGIETIDYLLQKVESLQREIIALRNCGAGS